MNKEGPMFVPMIFIKIIFYALFANLSVRLYFVAKRGRYIARGHDNEVDRQLHQRSVRGALISAVWVIVLLEAVVRLNGSIERDPLFPLHLSFAIPFFAAFLLLRFQVTGLKMKKYHARLAYTCLAFYVPALVTGLVMLYRM